LIEFILAFIVSLFAGLVGSMVGVGGGIINGPFLSYLDYIPSQISSTSLLAVMSTSVSSSAQYVRKRLVNYKTGLALACSSIPGTVIGVQLSNFMSIEQFRYYFGIILATTAIYLILRKNLINSRKGDESITRVFDNKLKFTIFVILSFFAGIISSSFGVGGGIIYVPCLVILMRFSMKASTATSQFVLVFTSLSGVILFALQGWPDYQMGIVLSIGSLIGGTAGSLLALRVDSSKILILFSLVLLVVSVKVFYDGFFGFRT
jgi:uncharacterized membrane protein YfcA